MHQQLTNLSTWDTAAQERAEHTAFLWKIYKFKIFTLAFDYVLYTSLKLLVMFLFHTFLLSLMEYFGIVWTLSHFLYSYLNLSEFISTFVLFICIFFFLSFFFLSPTVMNDLNNSASNICMSSFVELQLLVVTLYHSKYLALKNTSLVYFDLGRRRCKTRVWWTNTEWNVSGWLRCEIVMWRLRALIKQTVPL